MNAKRAIGLLDEMEDFGLDPDLITYNTALKVTTKNNDLF